MYSVFQVDLQNRRNYRLEYLNDCWQIYKWYDVNLFFIIDANKIINIGHCLKDGTNFKFTEEGTCRGYTVDGKKLYIKEVNESIKLLKKFSEDTLEYCKISNRLGCYNSKDELLEYLMVNYKKYNMKWFKKNHIKIQKILKNKNKISIDTEIYRYCNNIHNLDRNKTLKHICNYGVENGLIYHTKQIKNYLDDNVSFYAIDQKYLYLKKDNVYYDLNLFVYNIYKTSYNKFINDTIVLKNNIQQNNIQYCNNILYCCFIGDKEIGKELVEKIINYRKNRGSIYTFIFRDLNIYKDLIDIITPNFTNYILFKSKEYGNDIIPSLQVINYMKNKYNIKYIYKLHTKNKKKDFDNCINYLLSKPVDELVNLLDYDRCNCIGHPQYYVTITKDPLVNYKLYLKYKNIIDETKHFVASTNFFCEMAIILKILNFIEKNNYLSYFLNNMYDSNIVNLYNSPIHLLERLFGIIKI
jgi:hypothetical protein